MKVSLNWVKKFTNVNLSIEELVQKIGSQLGAIEEVIDLGSRYQGIVVAKVVSCKKHADADKLHVCLIDDGGVTKNVERDKLGYVQVVCGAPNVREGLLVAWLPPGSTVPETFENEPFVLESRKLRGIVSNGMLASAKELAIGDGHEGILEIDIDAKVGQAFADAYDLNDFIIDIENKMFTHRPDLFGQLGVAREIAGICDNEFVSPSWYFKPIKIDVKQPSMPISVINECPELVKRFMAVSMSEITVKPSPIIFQSYLSRVGIRPINNIVDITNYVMMLTSQPLHAYDYDKVKSLSDETPTLIVRQSIKGEKLNILGGKEVEFSEPAVVIASHKSLIGIGGVIGGADTEVDENTKSIILECANFDMYDIRRTSMRYGIFTDAVTRFNKGQSPLQNSQIISIAISMINDMSGGKVTSQIIDDNHVPVLSQQRNSLYPDIDVNEEFINSRLGLDFTNEKITELLKNVEFDVKGEKLISIKAPYWRTDIEQPEDIVEEIGRLYGFDNLPIELPKRLINPAKNNKNILLKHDIRTILANYGANEFLTYSFVHGNLLEKVGQDKTHAYELSNAISPSLQYFRLSLTPSLLDKVHANHKAGYSEFAVFEIGKGHNILSKLDADGVPSEYNLLALVFSSNNKLDKKNGAAYFKARSYLDNLAKKIGILIRYEIIKEEQNEQIFKPFDINRSAFVIAGDNQVVGIIGEYKRSVIQKLKLPINSAGFEINLDKLWGSFGSNLNYRPLPKFPKVEQDISLKVASNITYYELFECIKTALDSKKPTGSVVNLFPLDIYQSEDCEYKHMTWRLQICSYVDTLKNEYVNDLLDEIADRALQKFKAVRL